MWCVCVATKAPRKTRAELAKLVDADYYGYRDEEDGLMVPLEQEEEKRGLCKYLDHSNHSLTA